MRLAATVKLNTNTRFLRLENAIDLKKYRMYTMTDCVRYFNRLKHNLLTAETEVN